ncbi:MAG: hypothetical protein Q4E59_03465 [Bacteroidales bacterium]|nr:hypothetical protein [Bacteroidales bacterium]
MDIKFQDRIDDYLLNRMNDADKEAFLQDVEQDEEKKAQLEFTRNVKYAICSRESKVKALADMRQRYEYKHRGIAASQEPASARSSMKHKTEASVKKSASKSKKLLLWIAGIAAVFVVGFFAIRPMFILESSVNSQMERLRNYNGNLDGDKMKSSPSFKGTPNDNAHDEDKPLDKVDATTADTIENDTTKFNEGIKKD